MGRKEEALKIEDSMSKMDSSSKEMLLHMKKEADEREVEQKEKMKLFGQLVGTLKAMQIWIIPWCYHFVLSVLSQPTLALIMVLETFMVDDTDLRCNHNVVQVASAIHEGATRGILARWEHSGRRRHERRACWAYPRPHKFLEGLLMSSYSD
ncbi:hypothetical protein GOP47_0028409, partial [Adiantum capillus-veneris]